MRRSRRAILRGTALVGAVGLAGCHQDTDDTNGGQTPGNGNGGSGSPTGTANGTSNASQTPPDATVDSPTATTGSSEAWRTFQVDLQNGGAVPLRHGQFTTGEKNWSESLAETGPTQPVFDRDGLYVATRGMVYAFDRASLDRRWTYEVHEQGPATPAIDDRGFVYVSTSSEVVKLHGEEGWSAWTVDLTSRFSDVIGVTAKSAPVLYGDTVIVNLVMRQSGGGPSPVSRTFGLDTQSGDIRWQYDTPRTATVPQTNYAPTPAIEGNTLYVPSGHGEREAALYALNPDNGKKRWSRSYTGKGWSSATVSDGLIYMADRYIQLFDTEGNHPVRRRVNPQPNAYAVAAGSEHVFMSSRVYGGNQGRLFAVDDRGTVEWTFEGEGNLYVPTATDDVVYVASGSGSLFALDQSDGLVNWRHDLELPGVNTASAPAISTDEIYVAAASRSAQVELYAIGLA